MTDYGGMGGVQGGRPRDETDRSAVAVESSLGDALRADGSLCIELWSALSNQDWRHENGDTAGYSFRAAGDLVAAVIGRGDYMDWYCSGEPGVVSERIRAALAREGWTPTEQNRYNGSP